MKEGRAQSDGKGAGIQAENRNREPHRNADRYPEETVIDALLESDEGDEIPPPEEDIFALPVLPREEGEP